MEDLIILITSIEEQLLWILEFLPAGKCSWMGMVDLIFLTIVPREQLGKIPDCSQVGRYSSILQVDRITSIMSIKEQVTVILDFWQKLNHCRLVGKYGWILLENSFISITQPSAPPTRNHCQNLPHYRNSYLKKKNPTKTHQITQRKMKMISHPLT